MAGEFGDKRIDRVEVARPIGLKNSDKVVRAASQIALETGVGSQAQKLSK